MGTQPAHLMRANENRHLLACQKRLRKGFTKLGISQTSFANMTRKRYGVVSRSTVGRIIFGEMPDGIQYKTLRAIEGVIDRELTKKKKRVSRRTRKK